MGLHLAQPSDILSPFVKSYWGLENRMAAGDSHLQRIIPSGLGELTFYLKDLPQSLEVKRPLSNHTLLSGQQKSHYDLRVEGHLSLFSVIFQPHGLMHFFPLPAGELFDLTIPLHFLLKNETMELEDRLAAADSFQERKRMVENFLIRRLTKSGGKYEHRRIAHSIGIINRSRGNVDIQVLASEACLSRKQFERTFLCHVGATPKLFLRTVRFQHAIHEKAMQNNLSLTELSYRSGYYDQSHMIADFRKLSGMSPRKFFADCDPYSDYFQ